MRDETEFEKRRQDILAAIVRGFIASGAPVGSKAVAEQLSESLSSATIRNVMVELEADGYLGQPHVSAGRVPTDKAYRFYVDKVAGPERLGQAMEHYIDMSLSDNTGEPEQLMAKTSQVLAKVSHHVGLVLGPAPEEKLLEHFKFVRLPDCRVLVVIVSRPDLVENKVLRLEEDFSQEDLDRVAEYLNGEFQGWSLRTIRLEIFKRMEEERLIYDRLLNNVATLFTRGALGEEVGRPLFVDGTAKILDRPEFEDAERIRELVGALEEKAKVIHILSACLESPSSGVRVLIGRENPEKRMHQCSFIVAPFHYRQRAVGALGVVGPTRMEYERAITTVIYVAHLTSKLLSNN
jgi:heat-inducible transcriptional repressor